MNAQLVSLFTLVLISFNYSMAQTNSSIRTGRPGQAIGPYVAGKGYLQIQSGIDLSKSDQGINPNSTSQNSNTVIRVGLSEAFELSGLFVYQNDKSETLPNATTQSGVNSLHLGFRVNLISKPEGIIPGLGIQTRFKLNTVSSAYKSTNSAPVILVVTQHHLPKNISWVNNFGINYSGNTPVPTHLFISNFSFSITDKIGSFVEVYGYENSGRDTHFIDTGLSYLLNNDLQFDISGGWGENFGTTDHFVSFGISWRTQLLDKLKITGL